MARQDGHDEALPASRYHAKRLGFLSLGIVCAVLAVLILAFSLGFVSRPSQIGASYPQSQSNADVLLVMSYEEGEANTQHAREGVLGVLGRSPVSVDVVYMDAYHVPLHSAAYATWANDVGQEILQHGSYDAVICCDDEALCFVEENHDEIFASTPVIFFGVNDVAHAQRVVGSGYATGVIEQSYAGSIMEIAHDLQPDTTSFTVVTDQTPTGIGNQAQFASAAQGYEDMDVRYVDASNLTRSELSDSISSVGADSIVFLLDAATDSNGNVYTLDDSVAIVTGASNAPVYRVNAGGIGDGVAGSTLIDPEQDGRTAAEMTVAVLNGESPSSIPLVIDGVHGYVFDQQVLNSYGISVADVPPGSTVVNRQLLSLDTLRILLVPIIFAALALIFFWRARKMRHLQIAAETTGTIQSLQVPVNDEAEKQSVPVVNVVAEAPPKQPAASVAKRTKRKQLPANEGKRRDAKRGHQRQLRHTHPVSIAPDEVKSASEEETTPAIEGDVRVVAVSDESVGETPAVDAMSEEVPREIESQLEESAEAAAAEEVGEPAEQPEVEKSEPGEQSVEEEAPDFLEQPAQTIEPSAVRATVGIEILNLDEIEDAYGAQTGQEVLSVIQQRLKGVENSHILQVDGGRILLGFDANIKRGSQELELIELLLSQPATVGEHAISLNSCIGVVNKPHTLDFASMKACSDFAIKQAEERGHMNAIVLYDDDIYSAALNRDKITGILRRAIEQEDFLVFYQPQVDLHKNEVVGYEALVRLKNKVYPPSQFIPVAEVTGLIVDIDRIVTKRSIELLSIWKRRKKRMRPISINFSSVHLTKDDDFADYLLDLLKTNGVPSEYVRIEVDESLFSSGNQQRAEDMVRRLFDAGVSIALDNFGKGYATFTDIMTIPASVIKIDKEFVDTFLVDGHDQNFEQLVRLAHGLGRKVVVVGVDKGWQIDACRNLNCDIVQGYYFSKPLLPENAVQYKPRA